MMILKKVNSNFFKIEKSIISMRCHLALKNKLASQIKLSTRSKF